MGLNPKKSIRQATSSSPLLILILLSALLFFMRLGSVSVYQVAEARNATCAREMLLRDDWVVPTFNGQLRTDKPALEYFAMMIAYRVGGISEGSARFFSALCGFLLILCTFLFAKRHIGQEAAWWSALVLLASPHLITQFRLATPDPYLILSDTLALYCFLEGWLCSKRRTVWYLGMYAFLGLALLAKGPIGLLLPGLILLIFLLCKRQFRWKTFVGLRPWGILLTMAIAAPWYVLVHVRTNGAWTKGFFLAHNVGRFSDAMGGHSGLFLLTLLFVFAGMLPFSVFIVHVFGHTFKRIRQHDLWLLCLISVCVIIGFYAISRTKLINYTVPCYPFLALMTGMFLAHLLSGKTPPKALWAAPLLLAAFGLAVPVAFWFWTHLNVHLMKFNWLTPLFLIYPLGTGIALWNFSRRKFRPGIYAMTCTFIAGTILLQAFPYPYMDQYTPMRKAAPLLGENRAIAAYQRFNPAFVFYAGHPIPVLKDSLEVHRFLQIHTHALILSDTRDQQLLTHLPSLQLIRKDHEIFNSHTSRIYRNGP